MFGQISCCCWALVLISFATGPSRMSVYSTTSIISGSAFFHLGSYFAVMMGKDLMSRSAVELESKDAEFHNARMYPIVARHQFTASLSFFGRIPHITGKTAVDPGDRSPVSVHMFHTFCGLFDLFIFTVLVVIVCSVCF
ncbi:hypothetical protein BJ741DRAFT_608321 [Chytriomyces cf. hyalinus JEL632]|nr:hypothetical protein BJ741DRAFT_608321 [Chytriomyces cf. hyalinus JEL632]